MLTHTIIAAVLASFTIKLANNLALLETLVSILDAKPALIACEAVETTKKACTKRHQRLYDTTARQTHAHTMQGGKEAAQDIRRYTNAPRRSTHSLTCIDRSIHSLLSTWQDFIVDNVPQSVNHSLPFSGLLYRTVSQHHRHSQLRTY